MKSIAELLSLRYQYENYIENLEIPIDKKNGHINNLVWFKDNGHVKNRFRKGYDESILICKTILDNYYKRE
tara:strand:- start:1764 stop:1976 length:213 start_codon:yes stop_codon:yes gene_type:complete